MAPSWEQAGPGQSCFRARSQEQFRASCPGRTAVPTWMEGTVLGKCKGRLRSWGRQLAFLSSTLPLEHSQSGPGGGAQNQVESSHSLIFQLLTDFLLPAQLAGLSALIPKGKIFLYQQVPFCQKASFNSSFSFGWRSQLLGQEEAF